MKKTIKIITITTIILIFIELIAMIIIEIFVYNNYSRYYGRTAAITMFIIIPITAITGIGLIHRNEKKITQKEIEEKEQKTHTKENKYIKTNYVKKNYQTETEKQFYDKLIRATYEIDVQIIPQIPLSSIIRKTNSKYQTELYRIIDYGVFDKDFNLIILIELNDNTHLEKSRQYRDIKVKQICNEAKIKLITFWTKCNNEIEYIRQRINEAIEEKETA